MPDDYEEAGPEDAENYEDMAANMGEFLQQDGVAGFVTFWIDNQGSVGLSRAIDGGRMPPGYSGDDALEFLNRGALKYVSTEMSANVSVFGMDEDGLFAMSEQGAPWSGENDGDDDDDDRDFTNIDL